MESLPCASRRVLAFVLAVVASLLAACASLPERPPLAAAHALVDVEGTALAKIAAASRSGAADGSSGFRLLPEGEQSLNARIVLARRAEKSIDAQYYLIQNDAVGRRFLRELRDAAARGVRVRLLVDDLYEAVVADLLADLALHPNVDIRVFNPLPVRSGSPLARVVGSLHQFARINRRMHNKLFVADNVWAVTGGRNIADEYFMHSTVANFVDLDVLASGPIVRELSDVFDTYWNSEVVYPFGVLAGPPLERAAAQRRFDERVRDALPHLEERPRDVLGRTPVAEQFAGGRLEQSFGPAMVFADSPLKAAGLPAMTVTGRTLGMFALAQEEVRIVSPYFIPGERGMAMMRGVGATDENGKIVLVTNSLGATDEPLVYAGYARYRLAMLQAGVRIYELSPTLARTSGRLGNFGSSFGRLHAKTATIDRRWIIIGSMNLDPRSALLNTEMSLAIDNPKLAADANELGEQALGSGAYRLRLAAGGSGIEWIESSAENRPIVHGSEPGDSWLLRMRLWFQSLFVNESLL